MSTIPPSTAPTSFEEGLDTLKKTGPAAPEPAAPYEPVSYGTYDRPVPASRIVEEPLARMQLEEAEEEFEKPALPGQAIGTPAAVTGIPASTTTSTAVAAAPAGAPGMIGTLAGGTHGAAVGPGVQTTFMGSSPAPGLGMYGASAAAAGLAAGTATTTIPETMTRDPKDSLAGMLQNAEVTFTSITRNWMAAMIRPGGLPVKALAPFVEDISGCLGFCYLQYSRGGLGLVGSKGAGFAMIRLADGRWSAPAALKVMGVSAGLSIGYSRLKTFVFLQDTADVETLLTGENDREFDANCNFAIGSRGVDLGTGKEVNFAHRSARTARKNKAYGLSKGLIADLSLGGLRISHDEALNHLTYSRYGPATSVPSILSGQIPTPPQAESLVHQIEGFLAHAKHQYQL